VTKTNCPNCGAPAKGPACEYCGTPLKNPQEALSLAIGKTVSVSFEHEGRLYEFDMALEDLMLESHSNPTTLYDWGGKAVSTLYDPTYEATLRCKLVPSVKHGREGMWFYRELAPDEVTV